MSLSHAHFGYPWSPCIGFRMYLRSQIKFDKIATAVLFWYQNCYFNIVFIDIHVQSAKSCKNKWGYEKITIIDRNLFIKFINKKPKSIIINI